MSPVEQVRLSEDLTHCQRTVDALILRLEHTLTALALTLDAQAAMRQRLDGDERDDDHLNDTAADLQTRAEQVRHFARALTNGCHYR
jgi:hypothetical protein